MGVQGFRVLGFGFWLGFKVLAGIWGSGFRVLARIWGCFRGLGLLGLIGCRVKGGWGA